jgi:hypothetical protein
MVDEIEEKGKYDQLCQNYQKMNETGKEKLKEVSEKILAIWNVVNKEKEL